MAMTKEKILAIIEQAYIRGWDDGYYEGGEHDCRMFHPSARRSWRDARAEMEKKAEEIMWLDVR